jgi:uncharacterized phage infection (PIP) family protein YhgE
MLDSHKIYNTLKASFSPEQAEVLTTVVSEAFLDFSKLVTKQEFTEIVESQRKTNEALNQLTVQVRELTEAQKQTEQRLNELAEAQKQTEQRLNELAEAQKQTEQRLNELAEAQKQTEQRLNELAEAQKQTEQRLNELAEAQKQTEQRLNELAEIQKNAERNTEKRFNDVTEAQRRTDERFNALNETMQKQIQELAEMRLQFSAEIKDIRLQFGEEIKNIRLQFGEEIKDIRQQLGGLAMAVGYGIEDKVMPYFFDLAKKDYAIQLERVDRRNYTYPDGRYDEINIFAEGMKSGKKHVIVAECKAQPSKKDADRFIEMVERLKGQLKSTIHTILIGYVFSPEVERYVQEKYPNLRLMKTYEFELNYRILKKKNIANKK